MVDLVREESLAQHLDNEAASRDRTDLPPLYFLQRGSLGEEEMTPDLPSTLPDGVDVNRAKELLRDGEIRIARDLLLTMDGPSRAPALDGLGTFVDDQRTKELTNIAASLGERTVDWSLPEAPTEASATARLRARLNLEAKGAGLKAGETGKLKLTVTNVGDAPAYQVRGMSDSDNAAFDEREFLVGKINPGQSRSVSVEVGVRASELSRADRVDLNLFSHAGPATLDGQRPMLDIDSIGLPRPSFAFGYQVIDDPAFGDGITGNGDGALQVGERVRLMTTVRNAGAGAALDTWVHLRNFSGEAVFIHEA